MSLTLERRKAYTEILEVLRVIDNVYSDKVPKDLVEFFDSNKDKYYGFYLNSVEDIDTVITNPITIDLIGMLRYMYWTEDKNEKQKLLKIFKQNNNK